MCPHNEVHRVESSYWDGHAYKTVYHCGRCGVWLVEDTESKFRRFRARTVQEASVLFAASVARGTIKVTTSGLNKS